MARRRGGFDDQLRPGCPRHGPVRKEDLADHGWPGRPGTSATVPLRGKLALGRRDSTDGCQSGMTICGALVARAVGPCAGRRTSVTRHQRDRRLRTMLDACTVLAFAAPLMNAAATSS